MARTVTCCDAAILPELEDKRTLRGHRESVAVDPFRKCTVRRNSRDDVAGKIQRSTGALFTAGQALQYQPESPPYALPLIRQ
jgi:hypothetical protein